MGIAGEFKVRTDRPTTVEVRSSDKSGDWRILPDAFDFQYKDGGERRASTEIDNILDDVARRRGWTKEYLELLDVAEALLPPKFDRRDVVQGAVCALYEKTKTPAPVRRIRMDGHAFGG